MAAVSKAEYLKRYLSNADCGEKKKRKKKVKTGIKTGKSRIIDDDVNLSDLKVRQDSESSRNLLELAEDNPLIFNETGTTVLSKDLESIKKKEDERKAMWAPIKSFKEEIPAVQNAGDPSPVSKVYRRTRHDSSSPEEDASVSKQNKQRHDSEDISPRRYTRHDSSSDQSPPRSQINSLAPKSTRHDSPDLSPLRRSATSRVYSATNQSPQRRTRHDSYSDQSPPRNQQGRTRNDSPDFSPCRKIRDNRSPDLSPPRRNRHDSPTQLPQRKRARSSRHDTNEDQLPQRRVEKKNLISNRSRHDSPDLSPPRKISNAVETQPDHSPSFRRRHDQTKRSLRGKNNAEDLSPTRKQKSSQRKAGLHSAAELRQENERMKQRENEMFSRMSSNKTGQNAETVHRDSSGRKRDFKVEEVKKREEERKKEEENEKFMEWGKGVQQTKSAIEKVEDDIYEMSKPLARYKNDEDLDRMLRDRERSEDPMLAFLQKKKTKQDVIAGKKEKPKYKGPAPPPNRFNIPPGYRWDGVDRSNGFEKRRFSMLANKGATREEAYKWSTEDM